MVGRDTPNLAAALSRIGFPHERLQYGKAQRAWVRSLPINRLCGNERVDMHFGHLNSARGSEQAQPSDKVSALAEVLAQVFLCGDPAADV